MPIDIYKNPDVLKVIQDGVENGILTICSRVRSEAVSIAQGFADTGNLMNSIVYKTSIGGNGTIPGVEQPKKMQGYVGSPVEYAVYQEFGTRRMKPQPYLRPAIAKNALGQSGAEIMKKRQEEMARGKLTQSNISQRETFGVGNLK